MLSECEVNFAHNFQKARLTAHTLPCLTNAYLVNPALSRHEQNQPRYREPLRPLVPQNGRFKFSLSSRLCRVRLQTPKDGQSLEVITYLCLILCAALPFNVTWFVRGERVSMSKTYLRFLIG